jgi:hypothetical protein
MNNVRIEKYNPGLKDLWDQFITDSKNGLFLFYRNYMEYHADRFTDHSLLFYKEDELLCVMPASRKEAMLNSHGGLTYGGFIMGKRASSGFVLEAMQAMLEQVKAEGIKEVIYKPIPYIYHSMPAQEDLYALFRVDAKLYRRDISSIVDLSQKISYTKGTKSNLSKARKNNLVVSASNDFTTFMKLEEELLRTKYNVKPTHTAEEITMLAERFPENIKLYMVHKDGNSLGGTITYETPRVIHTQYIGITDEGKDIGALDIIVDTVLQNHGGRAYFSFGISTVEEGRVLNEGLIRNKESFGARAIVHDFYKIQLT